MPVPDAKLLKELLERRMLDRLERSGLERLEHHHKPKVHSSLGVLKPEAADKILRISTPAMESKSWLDKAIAESKRAGPGEWHYDGRKIDKVSMDEVAGLDPEKFAKEFLTDPDAFGATITTGSVSTEAAKSISYEDLLKLHEEFTEEVPTMTKRTLEDLPFTVQQAVKEEHIGKLDAALAAIDGLPDLWAIALAGPCKLTVKTGAGYKVKSHIGGEEFVMTGAYIGAKKGPILKLKPVSPAEYVYAEVPIADCVDLFSGDPMNKLLTVIGAASMGLPEPEPAKGTPTKLDAKRVAAYEDFGSF